MEETEESRTWATNPNLSQQSETEPKLELSSPAFRTPSRPNEILLYIITKIAAIYLWIKMSLKLLGQALA